MPLIFRVVSDDPVGTTTTVNLNVDSDAWTPVVSQTNAPITETIPFALLGANSDDIAAQVRVINQLMDDARYYNAESSANYNQEVWLDWQMDGETDGPRSRLVHSFDFAFDKGMWFTCDDGDVAPILRGVLTCVVNGWWEWTGGHDDASAACSPVGGEIAIGTAPPVSGDAPARMELGLVQGLVSGSYTAYKYWLGFRSDRMHIDADDFVPIWEFEDGTSGDLAETAAWMQAGGSPSDLANNCMACNFATTENKATRCWIEMGDVTANFEENFGRFVVLVRAQTDAGTTCEIEIQQILSFNYPQGFTGNTSGTIEIDTDGAWKMYDTGLIVQHPPVNLRGGSANVFPAAIQQPVETYGFVAWAERTAGFGGLYLDCLVLIPIDEYFIYYEGAKNDFTSARIVTSIDPRDSGSGWQETYSTPPLTILELWGVAPPVVEGPGIPVGESIGFFAAVDYDDENAVAAAATVETYYIPRFKSLQGDA